MDDDYEFADWYAFLLEFNFTVKLRFLPKITGERKIIVGHRKLLIYLVRLRLMEIKIIEKKQIKFLMRKKLLLMF